jgi:hypothetical protein
MLRLRRETLRRFAERNHLIAVEFLGCVQSAIGFCDQDFVRAIITTDWGAYADPDGERP